MPSTYAYSGDAAGAVVTPFCLSRMPTLGSVPMKAAYCEPDRLKTVHYLAAYYDSMRLVLTKGYKAKSDGLERHFRQGDGLEPKEVDDVNSPIPPL